MKIVQAKLAFILVLLICLANSICLAEFTDQEVTEKIEKLNDASLNELGIPLIALLYLKNASPNSYLLLDALKRSGDIHKIKLLEKKGYVYLKHVEFDTPDGGFNVEHLVIMPTPLGYKVQAAL